MNLVRPPSRTRPLLFVLAVAGVVSAPWSPASAHNFSAGSSTAIGYGKGRFSGRVVSRRWDCRGGRTVMVIRKRPGVNRLVGTTTSSDDGAWSIRGKRGNGRYYAVVTERLEAKYGHSHFCESARSGDEVLGLFLQPPGNGRRGDGQRGGDGQPGGADVGAGQQNRSGTPPLTEPDARAQPLEELLPLTGAQILSLVAGALGVIALGSLMLRRSRHRRWAFKD